jgi:hypothetical protein
MKTFLLPLFLVLAAIPAVPGADAWKLPAETAKLKPGPGAALAVANCSACHSVDYITTQPALTPAQWRANVLKMQKVFGAPISTNLVDGLVEYLSTTYSSGTNVVK